MRMKGQKFCVGFLEANFEGGSDRNPRFTRVRREPSGTAKRGNLR
jgi:hypothetical protein